MREIDLFLDSFCLLGQIFSRRVDHLGQTLLPGGLDILGALPLLIQGPVWSLFCLGILPDVNIHTRLDLGLNLLGHDVSRGLLGPDIGQGHLDILNATDLDLGLLDLDILELCSLKNTSADPSVALLSELVKQQGDMLKKLSERMDTFSQNSSTVDKEKSLSSVDSGTEQNIDPCTDQIQLCVGSNETIGVVSKDDDNKGELEVPKESLSYRDAIVKLRSRLGSEVCPTPEVTNKMSGTSALEFFKDPDQTATVSLALPQSNSVVESLVKMNKRLKGEEEIAMSPLPIYPKGFKPGSFVALNSKPRVFLPSSYEAFNPHISLDPPSLNPGLKDVIKQGSAIPSSHNAQFSTLENWEKLARAGIQVASHSELFLCGTLKTIKNENLSKDDMLEVSRYLQAVAQSQSHLVEILSRLASGPLLARRDACLSVTDLDTECKQSLRVQPMESATIFGNKFPEVVSQYKESLAHKSLQMAVVNASKQQSSGFKNKDKKPSGYNSKGRPNTLSVTVGPGSSRTSNFSQANRTARNARKNVNNQASFKSSKKGKGQKPSPP